MIVLSLWAITWIIYGFGVMAHFLMCRLCDAENKFVIAMSEILYVCYNGCMNTTSTLQTLAESKGSKTLKFPWKPIGERS